MAIVINVSVAGGASSGAPSVVLYEMCDERFNGLNLRQGLDEVSIEVVVRLKGLSVCRYTEGSLRAVQLSQ